MIACANILELTPCKFLSVDFIGYKFLSYVALPILHNEETTAIAIAKIGTSNKLSHVWSLDCTSLTCAAVDASSLSLD